MDLDELEREYEEKQRKKSITTSATSPYRTPGFFDTASAIADPYEEWEEYMQFGGAGRRHIGFHLPHRTQNDT